MVTTCELGAEAGTIATEPASVRAAADRVATPELTERVTSVLDDGPDGGADGVLADRDGAGGHERSGGESGGGLGRDGADAGGDQSRLDPAPAARTGGACRAGCAGARCRGAGRAAPAAPAAGADAGGGVGSCRAAAE